METKRINLALQGGGAHGAYTWGVLDRLLEENRLEVEAISGTSAGAMNAAVFADGMGRGGRREAKRALESFWRDISQAAPFGPLWPTPFDRLANGWNLDHSAAFVAFDLLTRMLSPYQFNPTNYNPLRGVLEKSVDFKRLEGCRVVKLFISTTNVKTGKVRIFKSGEITSDVLLASACLPFLYQAVTIDGDPYWDGGYMGNPAIFPLIYGAETPDLVIVQINPLGADAESASADRPSHHPCARQAGTAPPRSHALGRSAPAALRSAGSSATSAPKRRGAAGDDPERTRQCRCRAAGLARKR